MGGAVLEAKDVVGGYTDLDILHGASVAVRAGEVVCILGPNGAGKSTLLKCVAGLLKPRGGKILLDGRDVGGLPPDKLVAAGIAYVPQVGNVFAALTVDENLDMGAYLVRDAAATEERRGAAFALFPVLAERRRQLAGSMSGGEQKMLEIARSLMAPLKLLILDEPSLGLAPMMVETIFDRIQALTRRGLTVLLVEQNARHALRIARRGYVLELGRVRLHDTSERLLEAREVREAYLGI